MAIQNIQALQYNIKDLTDKSNEYLLQSLANLGQRTGIKGDGIATNSFAISSLIPQYDSSKTDDYCGCIKYSNDNIYVQIVKRSNIQQVIYSKKLENIFTHVYVSDKNIELPVHINGNVEHYNAGGKIIYDVNNSILTTMFIGNDSNNDVEFTCIQFDYINNMLLSEILLTATYPGTEGVDSIGHYDLYYAYCDTDDKTLYHYKKYNCNVSFTDDNTSLIFNTIKQLIKNNSDIDISTLIGSLYYIDDNNNVTYLFDNEKYQLEDFNYNIEYKNFYVNTLTENSYIPKRLNNDLIYFYTYIAEYWNQLSYKQNTEQLYANILNTIAKKFYDEYIDQDEINVDSINIYYPLNYRLTYYCNANDNTIIYSLVDNIPCNFYNDRISSVLAGNDIIMPTIAVKTAYSKIRLYNFRITYNNDNPNIITGMEAYRIYTLPYINDDDYWVVNEITTSVKAKGENAGNPNVIMAITDGENLIPMSLGNLDDSEEAKNWFIGFFNNTDEISTNVYIATPSKFVNSENSSSTALTQEVTTNENANPVKVLCHLPIITNEEEYKIFKYSLFVNMYKVPDTNPYGGINEDMYTHMVETYGVGNFITTFWTAIRNIDNFNIVTYTWEPLTIDKYDKIISLTPAELLGLPGLFDYYFTNSNVINANSLIFDYIHFSEVYKELKQTATVEEQIEKSKYPIFRNVNAQTYIQDLYSMVYSEDESNKYINDSIFQVALYDTRTPINGNEKTGVYRFNRNVKQYLNEYVDGTGKLSLPVVINRFNDSIFNVVPGLDLQEVFIYNSNFVNRVNILMPYSNNIDDNKYIYNAYIGIDYENSDPDTIHFGPSETNNNIGTATLYNPEIVGDIESISVNPINIFNTQKKLDIDFNRVKFKNTTICHVNWQKQVMQNAGFTYEIYNTVWNPIGKAYIDDKLNFDGSTTSGIGEVIVNVNTILSGSNNELYYINDIDGIDYDYPTTTSSTSTTPPVIPPIEDDDEPIYSSTTTSTFAPLFKIQTHFINLNVLLNSLDLHNIISIDNTGITSAIIQVKNESLYTGDNGVLMLTTCFKANDIYGNGIYTSNPLNISVIKKTQNNTTKYYITIDELSLGARLGYSNIYN